MDVNNVDSNKDGDQTRSAAQLTPSVSEMSNNKLDGSGSKKKRRRGKSKRKIMKPFVKVTWQDRRKNDKTKRNRFRKIVLNKTQAPFNNNQFLMEIHKPEPENNFNRTPARTRDSSFSIDSEDNYFYSLPEDEEEYLTKEFSSVYEDAQSERLSNMNKCDLIQEYLLLEAKYDTLMKRAERSKPRPVEEENDIEIENDGMSDRDSTMTDKDTSGTSSSAADEVNIDAIMRHVKEQENQIRELQLANEQLRLANEALQQRKQASSSEDSESDSSTSSGSSSSSSSCMSPEPPSAIEMNGHASVELQNPQNEEVEQAEPAQPLVNGFHNPNDKISD